MYRERMAKILKKNILTTASTSHAMTWKGGYSQMGVHNDITTRENSLTVS